MDNSGDKAQDTDFFFTSLFQFLSGKHTCYIVGLITGLNSVIKKRYTKLALKLRYLRFIEFSTLLLSQSHCWAMSKTQEITPRLCSG